MKAPPPWQTTHAVRLRFAPSCGPQKDEALWLTAPLVLRRPGGAREVLGQTACLDAMARYVLSFGADVEVIGPPALRRRVVEEARCVAALYAAGSD